MVKVFLRGGLGNQMFEYAAGLALAEKNKTSLLLDSVFLNDRFPRKEFTYRTYDLDIFVLKPKLTLLSRASSVFPIPGVWLGLDLALMHKRNFLGYQKIVKEKDEDAFDPAILEIKDDVVLWGRWQSEKYFESVEPQLRNAFRFRRPLEGEAKDIAQQIAASHSVSLHVRRGDFVSSASAASLMGETNLDYYMRAAKYISEKVSAPHFFIFSDDIAWCEENLKLDFPVTYVPASAAGPKAAFHLELMSLCKHNIIANSTFSWWGAWLNANPDKIVVAPKQWYGDGRPSNDIVPERWIKL